MQLQQFCSCLLSRSIALNGCMKEEHGNTQKSKKKLEILENFRENCGKPIRITAIFPVAEVTGTKNCVMCITRGKMKFLDFLRFYQEVSDFLEISSTSFIFSSKKFQFPTISTYFQCFCRKFHIRARPVSADALRLTRFL